MQWPTAGKYHREYVSKAEKCGHWTYVGLDGQGHALIECTRTGERISYSLHKSDLNGGRNFAHAAGRACGCVFVQPRGRKRSRKAVKPSGFSIEAATRENRSFHMAMELEIEATQDRLARLIMEAQRCASTGRRDDIRRIADLLVSIRKAEDELEGWCQPVKRFDPYSLAGEAYIAQLRKAGA